MQVRRVCVIILILIIVIFSVVIVGCKGQTDTNKDGQDIEADVGDVGGEDNTTEITVTFDSAGGTTVSEQKIMKGNKVQKPEDPVRANSSLYDYTFIAWYYDDTEWDFENNTVSENITLVAKWQQSKSTPDYVNGGL